MENVICFGVSRQSFLFAFGDGSATAYNNDYAVHSFVALSHSPTFASGTLSAYFTTGKRRIVMAVVRKRKICYNCRVIQ